MKAVGKKVKEESEQEQEIRELSSFLLLLDKYPELDRLLRADAPKRDILDWIEKRGSMHKKDGRSK